MQRYNTDSVCPKCGCSEAIVAFCRGWPRTVYIGCKWEGEHMHVQCVRCGYDWIVAPLDAIESPVEKA